MASQPRIIHRSLDLKPNSEKAEPLKSARNNEKRRRTTLRVLPCRIKRAGAGAAREATPDLL